MGKGQKAGNEKKIGERGLGSGEEGGAAEPEDMPLMPLIRPPAINLS